VVASLALGLTDPASNYYCFLFPPKFRQISAIFCTQASVWKNQQTGGFLTSNAQHCREMSHYELWPAVPYVALCPADLSFNYDSYRMRRRRRAWRSGRLNRTLSRYGFPIRHGNGDQQPGRNYLWIHLQCQLRKRHAVDAHSDGRHRLLICRLERGLHGNLRMRIHGSCKQRSDSELYVVASPSGHSRWIRSRDQQPQWN
jgi:hypothetical protein